MTKFSANDSEKTDYNRNIKQIENKIPKHDKFITTRDFNKLTTESFHDRLKQGISGTKLNIHYFLKNTYLGLKLRKINDKRNSNKANHRVAELDKGLQKLNKHIINCYKKLINNLRK